MDFAIRKRRRGEAYRGREKQMILNVFSYFHKTMNVSAAVKEASIALGCGENIIYMIRKENGPLRTPPKRKAKRKGIQANARVNVYDETTQTAIRRKVHSFFLSRIPPTLNSILTSVNMDNDIPNFKRTTLYKLLLDIGFVFEKIGKKAILSERDDIIRWRHFYLRSIKKYRQEKRNIVYTDETWVNAGIFVSKVWTDTTIKSSRQAFIEDLTTGITVPCSRGQRFALIHAGNEKGFISEAKFTQLCKKNTADAHEEICGEVYEKWLEQQLLPYLPPNSVIVLDNASYHSRKLEKIPTSNWKKQDIWSWLNERHIATEEGMLKRDLLHLVFQVKHQYDKYKIEDMAARFGHTVLRLPPYHCTLNPIEMVWAQVKHYIKMNNTTFKAIDIPNLVDLAYEQVSCEQWSNYVNHVKKVEDDMWQVDDIQDNLQEIIISINDDDSSGTKYSDSTDSNNNDS